MRIFNIILSAIALSDVVYCDSHTAAVTAAVTATSASAAKSDEYEDFTKWKTALNDVALRELFDKYIYEEPRSTDANGSAITKGTVTAASASLSHGGGGTQDHNKLTPAGYPISAQTKTWNDGADSEFTGMNKSPAAPVTISNGNQIQLAPYSNDKAVRMDLNGGDVLWVDTSDNSQVEIAFTRENTAQMKLNIYQLTKEIDFEYRSEFGKTYKTTKPAGDFTIPNLIHGKDGALVEAHSESKNFAIYRSADSNGSANLHIPSLGLNLNLNYKDLTSCLEEKPKKVEPVKTAEQLHGDFSYAQLGADWGKKYPGCNNDQQSPINLLDAKSKYGNSYPMLSSLVDQMELTYDKAKAVTLYEDTSENRIIINLSDQDEYLGFSSKIGVKQFGAPENWKAQVIEFKHGSEHTINDKRYDMEMQIYHTVHRPKKKVVATTKTVEVDTKRNLASDAGGGAAASSSASGSNDEASFEYAAISIMFSVEDFSPNITAAEKAAMAAFHQGIDGAGRAFDADLGKLMQAIDMSNRWIYKGSKTHPPCEQFVYWNIIPTVFPISQGNIDIFKQKIEHLNAGNTVNYREIQKGINKDVAYVSSGALRLVGIYTLSVMTLFFY